MSMVQVVHVEKKNKYGNELIYPVNEQAQNICDALGGQKTLTLANVKAFKNMGFIFKQCVMVNGALMIVGEL